MDKHWWLLTNSTIYGASSVQPAMSYCTESIWGMKGDLTVRRIIMKGMELSALTATDLFLERFSWQGTTTTSTQLVPGAANVEIPSGMERKCIFKEQLSGILDVDPDREKVGL